VHELVARANRVFCEGTLSSHFATLVCGRLSRDGQLMSATPAIAIRCTSITTPFPESKPAAFPSDCFPTRIHFYRAKLVRAIAW